MLKLFFQKNHIPTGLLRRQPFPVPLPLRLCGVPHLPAPPGAAGAGEVRGAPQGPGGDPGAHDTGGGRGRGLAEEDRIQAGQAVRGGNLGCLLDLLGRTESQEDSFKVPCCHTYVDYRNESLRVRRINYDLARIEATQYLRCCCCCCCCRWCSELLCQKLAPAAAAPSPPTPLAPPPPPSSFSLLHISFRKVSKSIPCFSSKTCTRGKQKRTMPASKQLSFTHLVCPPEQVRSLVRVGEAVVVEHLPGEKFPYFFNKGNMGN